MHIHLIVITASNRFPSLQLSTYLYKFLVHEYTLIWYTTYLSSDTYSHLVSRALIQYTHLFLHVFAYTDRKERMCHFVRAHILIHTSFLYFAIL